MGTIIFDPIGLFTTVTRKNRSRRRQWGEIVGRILYMHNLSQRSKRRKAEREKVLREKQEQTFLIETIRVVSLNPNRKGLCKVPKGEGNGFRRPRKPSPSGKECGAYRVDRSKIRKPYSD
jgi:hypothetical protein